MRRRCDQVVIPNPYASPSGGHSAGERQVIPEYGGYKYNEVPELWRKHAREPWRILFPDLNWKPPEVD